MINGTMYTVYYLGETKVKYFSYKWDQAYLVCISWSTRFWKGSERKSKKRKSEI